MNQKVEVQNQNPQLETIVLCQKALQWPDIKRWINEGNQLVRLEKFEANNIKEKTQIKELIKIPYLKSLCLNNIGATRMDNLSHLEDLQELDLQNNSIKSIENLSNNKKLKVVQLKANSIMKIQNLDSLTNLTFLNIQNNQLVSSQLICQINTTKLEYLFLNQNQITSFRSMRKCSMPRLKHLCITKNLQTDNDFLTQLHAPILYSLGPNGLKMQLVNCSQWVFKLQSEQLQRLAQTNQLMVTRKNNLKKRRFENLNKE